MPNLLDNNLRIWYTKSVLGSDTDGHSKRKNKKEKKWNSELLFSPHDEYLIESVFDIDSLLGGLRSGQRKTRILPQKGNVGIHILDLYRNKTGDDQVGIDDLPSTARNWRDDKYFAVSINEETARSSGKFLEYDTFYCRVSLDLMKKFETVDILDNDTEEPKLIVSIDKDKILEEWIEQGYPEELCAANKTEAKEDDTK